MFIGNLAPADAVGACRATGGAIRSKAAAPVGPSGDVMGQDRFYELLAEVDQFELVRMGAEPEHGQLALMRGGDVVGAFAGDHEHDESLSAQVLLENLSIEASGVHALRHLLATTGVDPASITHAIGCGEEAVGDRYQRGGGNVAKAIAEQCGLTRASGIDVKSFCAAPVHALVVAAALIEAGIEERVVVVAGGSLGKLGMKFEGALDEGLPGDRGRARRDGGAARARRRIERPDRAHRRGGPHAGGRRHRAAGAARGARRRAARRDGICAIADVGTVRDRDPQPRDHRAAGRRRRAPTATTRCSPGSAWCAASSSEPTSPAFARAHGMPGFSPTQGHIASAVPWLPHALARDARRRPAAHDVDREGIAVPRPADAAVGRRRP